MVCLYTGIPLAMPRVIHLLYLHRRHGAHTCGLAPFDKNQDFPFDPISTNQRLQSGDCSGRRSHQGIDSGVGTRLYCPPVENDVQIDLHQVVELRMGPAFDMGHELPPPDLALALTQNSLEPTLGIQRCAYWEEVNPLLATWHSNNAKCPECSCVIWVNMSRHLRLMHTTHVCYWRCPAPDCPLWFTSELNGKDHIERTHRFKEGRGYSFYECLREFRLEWFGSRAFFAERKVSPSGWTWLWRDFLARSSVTTTQSPGARTSRHSVDFSRQQSTSSNFCTMICQFWTSRRIWPLHGL